ncbi:unnamed protein product, partial [Brenthis ino]
MKRKANIEKNNEPKATSLLNANEMDMNETKMALCRKQKAFKIAEANKAMIETQKKMLEKERSKQEKFDEDIIRKVIEQETKIMADKAKLEREAIKEYESQNKKIKELKTIREEEAEKIRTIWQNYQEKVNYKTKLIFKEVINFPS